MYHYFKEFIALFLMPTPLITTFLILGAVMILRRRNSRTALGLIGTGALGLVLFGLDPATEYLLHRTESAFSTFAGPNSGAKYVVVLAGGYVYSSSLPLTSQLTSQTLVRLVEGIRLHRSIKGSKLVVTGKGWYEEKTEARAMQEMAIALGVREEDIIVEEHSKNTLEHTQNLANLLGKVPFVLVTSAIHMPRAMRAFKRAGMFPIAAPTGHILTGDYKGIHLSKPYITADNLTAIDNWFYEFWGRLKYE